MGYIEKLQSYKLTSYTYTKYIKNYKTTTQKRTYILDILAMVISYSSLETKTTKLQPKSEHIYRIFLPWSGVKMKNYKTTS